METQRHGVINNQQLKIKSSVSPRLRVQLGRDVFIPIASRGRACGCGG